MKEVEGREIFRSLLARSQTCFFSPPSSSSSSLSSFFASVRSLSFFLPLSSFALARLPPSRLLPPRAAKKTTKAKKKTTFRSHQPLIETSKPSLLLSRVAPSSRHSPFLPFPSTSTRNTHKSPGSFEQLQRGAEEGEDSLPTRDVADPLHLRRERKERKKNHGRDRGPAPAP